MISRQGRFHWNTIINELKAVDKCGIRCFEEEGDLFLRIEVKPSAPDKTSSLEAVLDAHDADAALATWNEKKNRQASAEPAIRAIPGWATWSAQETADHIDANVNDILSAKVAMKNMAKIICYLRDHAGIV